MPAAYAHHRFGEACLEAMPDKLRRICLEYRELYDIGVHGPDVLFYYKALGSNEVNRWGSSLHHWTGREFFAQVKEVYAETSGTEKKALLAYVLGFLAHFTLDSFCHDYINSMVSDELSHNRIESQYEAFLMRKDGREPLKVDRSAVLHPGPKRAAVISRLFPFSQKKVLKAMQGQKRILRVFYSPHQIKKHLIRWLLKGLKLKGNFGDLFLDLEVPDSCRIHNEEIASRQALAQAAYPQMLRELVGYLYGRLPLTERFDYDFEGISSLENSGEREESKTS